MTSAGKRKPAKPDGGSSRRGGRRCRFTPESHPSRSATGNATEPVLLSGRGEPEAQAAEELVLSSSVDAAVVRGSFFAQNFSEHFLLGPVLDGAIALPAGELCRTDR